jgi:hypothetical protein
MELKAADGGRRYWRKLRMSAGSGRGTVSDPGRG